MKTKENKHICFLCAMGLKRYIEIPRKLNTNKCQVCCKSKLGATLKHFKKGK